MFDTTVASNVSKAVQCQNLEQCSDAFMDEKLLDADVRYAVEYFGREYYVL
jgi:hypothetical protein